MGKDKKEKKTSKDDGERKSRSSEKKKKKKDKGDKDSAFSGMAVETQSGRDSDSDRHSMMSWPDSEPEPVAMPAMPKKKAPAPMPAAKEWIKQKLNKQKMTNKSGRQEVYDNICSVMDEIDVVCNTMYETLGQNKNEDAHLPVIKGFAEARGLYKRRMEKCKEHLGTNKTYLDHIRLHRSCLVDGVMFDSNRIYDDNSFKADMQTIKSMKRGIMKLMGKDPDQWEYDPAEFEELRKVRDNLTKIWGGHIIKKQKEIARMRGEAIDDMDQQDRINEAQLILKKEQPASAFKAKVGAVSEYEIKSASIEKQKERDARRDEEANMAQQVPGEDWAQQTAAQAGPKKGEEKMDMAAYSVESVGEEIDAAQEIIDAMDSFIPDKFYKTDVVELPDGKGRKFAGKLQEDKPEGRGVLVLENKSQHIGSFRKGRACGLGVFLNKDADSLIIGNWVDGKKVGKFYVLEKKTGQTYVEKYDADKRVEQVAGAVVPDSALKEHFLKRLARLKAKDKPDGAGKAEGGDLQAEKSKGESPNKAGGGRQNRRASANDADGNNRRGSVDQGRRGSVDAAAQNRRGSVDANANRRGSVDAGKGAGDRRGSLPKVDPAGQRRNSFSKQGE